MNALDTLDCDVLQADGGTRTASITGGCVALCMALEKLRAKIGSPDRLWSDTVAAISVGIYKGEVLVDLDYDEDSQCDVDMNIVMLGQGSFVEVQGTAEKGSFQQEELEKMCGAAKLALAKIRDLQLKAIGV